jgi:hypothetical protein
MSTNNKLPVYGWLVMEDFISIHSSREALRYNL